MFDKILSVFVWAWGVLVALVCANQEIVWQFLDVPSWSQGLPMVWNDWMPTNSLRFFAMVLFLLPAWLAHLWLEKRKERAHERQMSLFPRLAVARPDGQVEQYTFNSPEAANAWLAEDRANKVQSGVLPNN
jgi:hypothetical protein